MGAFQQAGNDIVRERIVGVKQRMEADIPISPPDEQHCGINATRRSPEILLLSNCERHAGGDVPIQGAFLLHVFARACSRASGECMIK